MKIQKFNEIIEDCSLSEDIASSMPTKLLPRDEVYKAIDEIIRPGQKFKVGYFTDATNRYVAADYREGSRRQVALGNPIVKIFKATQADGIIGFDYENLKDVKELRASGVERKGSNYEIQQELGKKIQKNISTGNSVIPFQPQPAGLSSKFYISIDGSDLKEATKDDIRPYCTPSSLNSRGSGEWDPTRIMKFNVNNVYWIKSKDFEIGRPLWKQNYKNESLIRGKNKMTLEEFKKNRKTRLASLHEALTNMPDVVDDGKVHGEVDAVVATAIADSNKRDKLVKDSFKDKNKEVRQFVKDQDKATGADKEEKSEDRLMLDESLFEGFDDDYSSAKEELLSFLDKIGFDSEDIANVFEDFLDRVPDDIIIDYLSDLEDQYYYDPEENN